MTLQGDPYRTLGVASGASLNEIRSAYRRLAKKYHPDAAGERALPRFLAIQAAYELLVDGDGRLRKNDSSRGAGNGARSKPGDGAGSADAGRARASRDAWRARRSTSRNATGESGAGDPGTNASASGGGRPRPTAGGSSKRSHAAGERQHARRAPRKATPGSTTYDEAAETPLDPPWDGGAWYGPTSGTYWTINPREYADPRKHGPEYLARARRATAQGAEEGGPPPSPAAGPADTASTEGPPDRDEEGGTAG
jgi:curved DNA-binding protein CbpA